MLEINNNKKKCKFNNLSVIENMYVIIALIIADIKINKNKKIIVKYRIQFINSH